MECFLAKVPVIVSKGAFAPYPAGVAGELDMSAGAEELASLIAELQHDEQKRVKQAQNAFAYVESHHAAAQVAFEYKTLIEKTIQRKDAIGRNRFIAQAGRMLGQEDADEQTVFPSANTATGSSGMS